MGAQEWLYGIVIYFIGIGIFSALIAYSGALHTSTDVYTTGGYNVENLKNPVMTNKSSIVSGADLVSSSGYNSLSNFFQDIYSIFVFNISLGSEGIVFQYFWIFRAIFIYIPLFILFTTVWYSTGLSSGGG